MEIIVRILILLWMLVTPTTATPSPEPPSEEATIHSLTVIEHVDALLLESFPVQINLVVTGYQSDGCDYPVQVAQRREGNEVFVEIFRDLPLAVICPAVLREYNATIHLDGGFTPGTYTIHVNDQVIEVTI